MFIEISSITKEFGNADARVRALQNVSLGIERGENVAIYGPSGSGKSTLLNVISGLLHPTSGRVVVDGIDIYGDLGDEGRSRFRCEYVGFVFQAFHLLPYLSAYENAVLPLAHLGIRGRDKRRMAEEVLHRVGLSDRLGHLPSELSGGQQQRVAIARALVNDPYIIVADEPTGNLDRESSEEILNLFRALQEEGRTIITVTHDETNLAHAGRTFEVVDGRIKNAMKSSL